jgi:hypothetical protein
VTLEGHFAIALWSKAFMTLWLGLGALIAAFAVVLGVFLVIVDGTWWQFAFFPFTVAILGTGVGFIRFAWRWSARDIPFVSSVVIQSLRREASNTGPSPLLEFV